MEHETAAHELGEGTTSTASEDGRTLPQREDAAALTIVALGASAGGIQALQAFFAHTPADSGLAFVVVMHLPPEHESHLAEVLGRATAIPILQVHGPVRIEPNRVYVIPPSKDLVFQDGLLCAVDSQAPLGRRIVIDHFFRALAAAHGPQAAAVVLSGAGADGALGLKQIKEQGGLTVAQDPAEAAHDAMPRNAIGTGLVDYVLPASEMAVRIVAYRDATRRMLLPQEAAPSPAQRDERPETQTALVGILAHLRGQTGHDFAPYKRATVLRRMGRRLQVNNLPDLPAYLDFLHRHPAEGNNLLGDLLISVTQFFRDAEVWEALAREVVPRLFEERGPSDEVRVWVCGCATGEEAYSLAILLLEQAARMDRPPRVQVFATDMSAEALASAREGSYPETIAADVSPERLRGWFYHENGRYRVRKEVREAVLFALHDVLRDTPFSRLDLVTCRNLLIYLNPPAQTRIFEIFHFALRPDGRLLLGSSESLDAASVLFGVLDKPNRLYIRRPIARPIPLVPPTPPRALIPAGRGSYPNKPLQPQAGVEDALPAAGPRSLSAGEIHLNLLEMYAPPSVLLSEDYQIVHLSAGAGQFLRFAGGSPTADLLRVLHPDLRLDVSAALYAARAEGRDLSRDVPVTLDATGPARTVRVTVRPVSEPEGARGFLLVLFELLPEAPGGVGTAAPAEAGELSPSETRADVMREMEMEIARLQIRLRSTIDQYEASAEELKASNEELQAVNEEMRSATEELETGREELQSVNEELSTVNQELKNRIEDVSHANADLHNLLVSTDIATIFVDRELRIKRYTPMAEMLFNIIPTDAGRPLAHLTHRLEYSGLIDDAEAVLRWLATQEREIRSADGRHFLARLSPYRTQEDRIDGVVVTFVDITHRKQIEEALRRAAAFDAFRITLDDTLRPLKDPGSVQAQAARVLGERFGVGRVFYAEMEADDEHAVVAQQYTHGMPEQARRYRLAEFTTLFSEAQAGRTSVVADVAADPRFSDAEKELFASLPTHAMVVVPLVKENRLMAVLAVHRAEPHDWTPDEVRLIEETAERTWGAVEQTRSEAALRESERRLQQAFSIETVGVIFFKPDGQVTQANDAFLRQSGYTRADQEAGSIRWDSMTPPEYMPRSLRAIDEFLVTGRTTPYQKECLRKDGSRWWALLAATRVTEDEGVEFVVDITESKKAEQALRESEERFRLLVAGAWDYAMFLLDPQYRITFWSAGAEHIFGWTEAEVLGQSGQLIFTPEDREQGRPEQEMEIAARQGSAADRRWHVRKDGSLVWADGVLTRLNDAGGVTRGFAKILRDATAEREAEIALRQAHDEMETRVIERTETLSETLVSLETVLAERREVEAERQNLLHRLVLAQEAERGRISRELHDQMGQHLTGLLLGLKTLESAAPPDSPAAALALRLQQTAADISAEVHHLAWDLRPAALDDLGLEATLMNYTQQWGERYGVAADFHSRNMAGSRLPADVETALYRIVQEALINVARHAEARRVGVLLERRGDHALLIVEDDGSGFDADRVLSRPQRLGVVGMRERATLVGGTISIESTPKGTTLFVRIPLQDATQEAPDA